MRMGEEEKKKRKERHEFLQTENELLLFLLLCVIFSPDMMIKMLALWLGWVGCVAYYLNI